MIMNRYDFMFVFDAKNANPNGDPDAGNMPRIDPETGLGVITDVCLKRKIRNYVQLKYKDGQGHRIYFKDSVVLNNLNKEAYTAVGENFKELPKDLKKARELTQFMCRNFYDIRTFGAVMTTEVNCGQVRGPVQLSFANSKEPIFIAEHSITRSSVTNEKDLEKGRTMGRKYTVPYGLYVAYGFVSPRLAAETEFTEDDLALLWESLMNAFENDQSAARPAGSMAMRKLIIFKHDSELGNAPSHKLFDLVKIARKEGSEGPARSFDDYTVTVAKEKCPSGVTIEER